VYGVAVSLDRGNVILVNRVDGVGGPPEVEVAGCIAMTTASEATAAAMDSIPAVREFVVGSHPDAQRMLDARGLARGAITGVVFPPIPAMLSNVARGTPCARTPVSPESGSSAWSSSSPGKNVSPGVYASSEASSAGMGYVIMVRGAPTWGASTGDAARRSNRARAGGSGLQPRVLDVQQGGVGYTASYRPDSNTLTFNGVTVSLDSGNVILVDRIDGSGGVPVVATGGCVSAAQPNEMIDVALRIPAVRAFVNRERE
jgi:hypothetical protein